jgi:hypothetical protein
VRAQDVASDGLSPSWNFFLKRNIGEALCPIGPAVFRDPVAVAV